MRYLIDIYQFDRTGRFPESIFRDLDPDAFEKHSKFGSWSMSLLTADWQYRSPAKRFITLCFGPQRNHPYMQSNALKFVFCAINRAKNGKEIVIERPSDFILSVQVYQVLVVLQMQYCIDPLYEHIRQTIKSRALSPTELEAARTSIGVSFPKLYFFALNTQEDREEKQWAMIHAGEEEGSTRGKIDQGNYDADISQDGGELEDKDTDRSFDSSAGSGREGTNTKERAIADEEVILTDEEARGRCDERPIATSHRRTSSEPPPYTGELFAEPPHEPGEFTEDPNEDLQ